MVDTPAPHHANIMQAVQSILDSDRRLILTPRDIALLAIMKHEVEASGDAAITLTYAVIRALHSRLEALAAGDRQGIERRLSESLNRLIGAECVARADMLRLELTGDTEFQITPIGDAIADWNLHQSRFTGEPLTAIFRAFIDQLGRILEDAKSAKNKDDWHFDVTQQMRHALKAMLVAIQRHQKVLDLQHENLREFVPQLLTQGNEDSIAQCEAQLHEVITTIGDLQEVIMSSASRAYSMLESIDELSRSHNEVEVSKVCDELARRLQNISEWTTQRAINWVEHHNVVHNFLRTIVRIDRQRRITEALKLAISSPPHWTFEIAAEPTFVRMREDVLDGRKARTPPQLSRESVSKVREFKDVLPDELPALLQRYLMDELSARGEAFASPIIAKASQETGTRIELINHLPWFFDLMVKRGKLDNNKKDWNSPIRGIEIQQVRVTK